MQDNFLRIELVAL